MGWKPAQSTQELSADTMPVKQAETLAPAPTPSGPEGPDGGIEAKIGRVVQRLTTELQGVLETLPGSPHRPQELAKLLGVNKTLSSRVLGALRTGDPLAAAHVIPGPEGLRTVLKAAAKKGARRASTSAAEEAVAAFDRLIRRDAGSRAALDAIISDSLPHAREKFELANKQAMFKAAANLKGVMAEIRLSTFLLHPSDDEERLDHVLINGSLGLRRLRPNAVIRFTSTILGKQEGHAQVTLDGVSVDNARSLLLEPFCSSPVPQLQTRTEGNHVHYVVVGNGIGPASAVDLVLAELNRPCGYRYQHQDEKRRTSGPGAEVHVPVRTLIFDALVHEEIWPGPDPDLRIYDTTVRGTANPNDHSRDIDLLDLAESIQFLGRGTGKCRAVEIPNYIEMLNHVCAKLGWDPSSFRAYRCRIQYPFYGSQVSMAFEPPEAPQA